MGKVLVQPQTLLYLSEERLWTPAVAGVAMGAHGESNVASLNRSICRPGHLLPLNILRE